MRKIIGTAVVERLKKSDRCYGVTYTCELEDCPLLQEGMCINVGMFDRCLYGARGKTRGWTRRAKSYGPFVREWRDKSTHNLIHHVSPEKKKITVIGDHVWLPYPGINYSDGRTTGAPFHSYSKPFGSTPTPFMLKWDLTSDIVVRLANYKPQAAFGGTMTGYTKEALPLFLNDLRDIFPDIFAEAVALDPKIVTIAAMAVRRPFLLGFLSDLKWYGRGEIDNTPYKVLGSKCRVEVKVDGLAEYPDAVGPITIELELPRDTVVHVKDSFNSYLRLERAAKRRKEGFADEEAGAGE